MPYSLCAFSCKTRTGGNLTLPDTLFSLFGFVGPGTRDLVWALSPLYRGHRCYSFLLVSSDDHDVSFLNYAQRSVTVIRVGLVPVKAGEVFLRPRILEYLAVARVNLVAHLAHVLDKQALQQGAREWLGRD